MSMENVMEEESWFQEEDDDAALLDHFEVFSYPNADLVKKATHIAERIGGHGFVRNVGVFGSTARGEEGYDIDLIIIDDGTVSDLALKELEERGIASSFAYSAEGSYVNICYNLFAQYMPGGLLGEFYKYLREEPRAIDLLFLNEKVRWDRLYLDKLVSCQRDPFFFRNIGRDALLFGSKKKEFRKNNGFPGFIDDGCTGGMTRRVQDTGFGPVLYSQSFPVLYHQTARNSRDSYLEDYYGGYFLGG